MVPLRAGLVYGALIGIVYLVGGLAFLLLGAIFGFEGMMAELGGLEGAAPPSVEEAGAAAVSGVFAVVAAAAIGSILGFVFGVLLAAVYNLVAGITGGIVVELSDP